MNSTRIPISPAIVLASLFLAGCGALPSLVKPPVSSYSESRHSYPSTARPDASTVKFWQEIRNWQGVPYQYGGSTDSGIDCSGFAMRLYESLYGIQLPRTTEEQINAGIPISQKALKTGDLVFFKFRNNTGHVGIYLSDRRFTHASIKKKGITISCLDNPYWKSRYHTARRILEKPPKQNLQTPSINLSDRTFH